MNLIQGLRDGIKPEPRISVGEWAELYRVLSATASARSGPYRMAITPYLAEPSFHLSNLSVVKELVFVKSAQVGGSELANNLIGYMIHISPGPMLMIQPTIKLAERYSKMRIQPMIDLCKPLSERVKPARSRDGGNTMLEKEFPGGILIISGANSAAGLRSTPIRVLILDEVDSYPIDLQEEGSAVELARARQITYHHSKKELLISTPTTDEGSLIWPEFEATDMRYLHIACPECGCMQHLEFEQLRYEYDPKKGLATNVKYQCRECEHLIDEKLKANLIQSAVWIQTAPDNARPDRVGYHMNAMYNLLGYGWAKIAALYEVSKNDTAKLKTFYNTVLALTSKDGGEAPDWQIMYGKREVYEIGTVSADVAFLTAGIDIQKDRIELEVVGWGQGKRSHSIEYIVLAGETSSISNPVWNNLDSALNKIYKRADGAELPILTSCIDTGYNTSVVHAFCRKHSVMRIIPIKGVESQANILAHPKAVTVTKKGKATGKTKVWSVGVGVVKTEFYGWLHLVKDENGNYPEGYCHFPQYDENYFKGLTAEKAVPTRNKNGYIVYVWKKIFERNEPLDCRVYARAAAAYSGMDTWSADKWNEVANKQMPVKKTTVKSSEVKNTTPQSPSKKSSFWNK